jgi:hypothetical protein
VYRPIAKQWLCKQQLLLGNAYNIHAGNKRTMVTQQIGKHVPTTIECCWKWCFLFGTRKMITRRSIWSEQLVDSCKSMAVKRRFYVCCSYSGPVIGTVLKSIARIWLVKTEKAATALQLLVVPSRVNKSNIQAMPCLLRPLNHDHFIIMSRKMWLVGNVACITEMFKVLVGKPEWTRQLWISRCI